MEPDDLLCSRNARSLKTLTWVEWHVSTCEWLDG